MSADNVATPAADAPVADAPTADAPAPVFYKIASKEGTVFRIEKKCLQMSKTLKDCAENLGYEDDNVEEKDPIPVLNVTEATFKLVHEYMEHHKNDAPRAQAADGADVIISEWDAKFLNIDNMELFDLICAANFLDMKSLLDVGCKTVANMVKGKSPEEMRQIFDIPTDEEDEARERAEAEQKAKEEAEQKAKEEAAAGTSATADK